MPSPSLSLLDLLCVETKYGKFPHNTGAYIYIYNIDERLGHIYSTNLEKSDRQDWGKNLVPTTCPVIRRSYEVDFLDALLLTHDHADAILGSGLSGLSLEALGKWDR